VKDKLEATIRDIEKDGMRHRAHLVATGGLFRDDLEPVKNPQKELNAVKSDDLIDEDQLVPLRERELLRK